MDGKTDKRPNSEKSKENGGSEGDDPSSIKLPKENKGINPKASEKKPSKTLAGETPSGAKQVKQKPKIANSTRLIPVMPTKEGR